MIKRVDNESELKFIWRLGQSKDKGELDMSWDEIADIINEEFRDNVNDYRSSSSYRKKYQSALEFVNGGVLSLNSKSSIAPDIIIMNETKLDMNKDGSYSSKKDIEMTDEQSKDPSYVLEAHGFDPLSWNIVSMSNTSRESYNRQEDKIVTLYTSRITVKPISEDFSYKLMADWFEKLDRNYEVPELKDRSFHLVGDKMLLINIADLHLNLQSTLLSANIEYDSDIAEELFFKVIEDVITRTMNYNFKEIIFCIGGDMLNGDNLSGSTTKGTPQNSDTHFYDAYERLCNMTVKAVDILRNYAEKVNVILVPGNHDEVTGFKLAKYVEAWFRRDAEVVVDSTPLPRKYKVFGKTLLCFTHNGDVKKLPSIVANEAREYWSTINNTEVFLQHLHSEQVLLEEHNMRIQRMPTISANSKWSNDCGYGAKRQCKTFILDIDDGITDILYTPIN